MTLQRLWTNIDTAPAGLLLIIFAIGAAVCAVAVAARWVVRKAAGMRAKRRQHARMRRGFEALIERARANQERG